MQGVNTQVGHARGRVGTGSRVTARFAAALLVFVTIAVGLADGTARADDLAQTEPEAARELAERYAPVIVLKAQEEPCDADGEPYAPTSVETVLGNPEVLLRQLSPQNPIVVRGPTATDLYGLGEGFFLDFPGGALDPGCIYERDFRRYSADVPVTVYAHVVQQDDHPDQLAVQYWFYWYYNDWNNKHESDWEGIQLLFDASSVDEALASGPVSVGYAQHEGGERAAWDSNKLEREGTHPVVYSSAGSHASYFGSAVYLGRSASEGFGCDNTDGPSDRFATDVVVLPDSVDDPDDPLAWLAYEGRWGERQSGAFNGPTGPAAKGRWLEPIDWHDELRAASVTIPAGDSIGEQVIGAFCGVVEWGSSQLILATTSPTLLLGALILLFVVARWLVRRTDWTRVAASPIVARRRAGQIIRAAYHRYLISWRDLLKFGVIYGPAVVIAGLLSALVALIPFLGGLLDLSDGSGGTNLVLASLVGSVPQVIAAIAVNAMVAGYLDMPDGERSAIEAIHRAWEHRRPLARAFGRAFVIVAALLISVVGIPWAIRQIVRYQFVAQTIVVEGMDGREALDRSTELVRGRWLHTAVLIALFNVLPFVTAVVIGLLLLLAVPSLPLWAFSALMTAVYAFLVPLTATAQTMLYGDAVAEHDQIDVVADAETVPA